MTQERSKRDPALLRAGAGVIPPVLRLCGITRQFPGVKALDQVSLDLYPGTVTALVGENGAGKSTLVKILTGIYRPDGGHIEINGKKVTFGGVADAVRAGVTAIHQETVLFDELSVAENIFLGHAPHGRFGLIDRSGMRRRAVQLLERIDAPLDPDMPLKRLGIASRHLVAIARALSVDARVVVMDEPTAALSRKEIGELFTLIGRLKAEGRAILFISHKFDEVFAIAGRYSVLRDGAHVGEGLLKDVGQDDLVRLMVGRAVERIFPGAPPVTGDVILRIRNFCHPTEFDSIDFDLREGEILGFYGLVGAGRSELMQAIFAITRPSAGRIELDGQAITPSTPAAAIAAGIVYVPEERGRQGTVAGLPIYQNVTLPSLRQLAPSGFVNLARECTLTRHYTERLDLRAAALDLDVARLSGGNQQKTVIARWLATRPRIIILDEPTKGIDIGSKAAVHGFMAELAANGPGIVMVSSEIPEIMGMSNRVIVMREGLIAAELAGAALTPEALIRHAAGIGGDA